MSTTVARRRLSGVTGGEHVRIRDVPDEDVRAHLLRIGLLDGPVRCRTKISKGPVIVERNGTTMALGASVAEEITVTVEEQ